MPGRPARAGRSRRSQATSSPTLRAEAKGSAMSSIVFTVEIRVKEGRQEEFLTVLRPVLDAMRHEKTFINAVLHRDGDDPTRFMLYESWADLDDVKEVQMKRDYRA